MYGDVVYVAPTLVPPFNLLDNGVASFVKVLPGMFPRRGVTATDVAASKAHAQAHPPTTGLQALFAPLRVGRDISNLIDVLALHHFIIPSYIWLIPGVIENAEMNVECLVFLVSSLSPDLPWLN